MTHTERQRQALSYVVWDFLIWDTTEEERQNARIQNDDLITEINAETDAPTLLDLGFFPRRYGPKKA